MSKSWKIGIAVTLTLLLLLSAWIMLDIWPASVRTGGA
jgi:hypothetical protein